MSDPDVLTNEEAHLLRWARDDAADGDPVDSKFFALRERGLCDTTKPRGEYGYLTERGAAALNAHHVTVRERETCLQLAGLIVTNPKPVRPMPKINSPRETGIGSQEHLARSLFIAELWEELERRAEKRPAGNKDGIRCWMYTRAPDEVAVVMWNDPAYAKQRSACESAAERAWSARRIAR
jgi:hypothetical protein